MLFTDHTTRRESSARLPSLISAVGIAGTAFVATGSREAGERGIPRSARNDAGEGVVHRPGLAATRTGVPPKKPKEGEAVIIQDGQA